MRTFVVYNMLGALLWSYATSLGGFFVCRSWDALEHWIKRTGLIALGIAVVGAITMVLLRRRKTAREESEAGVKIAHCAFAVRLKAELPTSDLYNPSD